MRHLHVLGCPAGERIYNQQEKKLDSRTISGYFIGYLDKSKGYKFYSPKHSTRIIETGNTKFLENGEINGSEKMREVNLEKTRIDVPTFNPYRKIVVHQVAQQTEQTEENEQHVRNNPPSHNYHFLRKLPLKML